MYILLQCLPEAAVVRGYQHIGCVSIDEATSRILVTVADARGCWLSRKKRIASKVNVLSEYCIFDVDANVPL